MLDCVPQSHVLHLLVLCRWLIILFRCFANRQLIVKSASSFQMFAAWFQFKSFRDDSIRSNSLIQAGRLHLIFSSFRSWRQSTVELAVVSRNYSAATNLFLAKPLCPAWPIFPAFLSLRSGWLRSLSVTETQGNLWEDRRLCFRPFIKWLSTTRSPSLLLSKDLSARELFRPADEFSTLRGRSCWESVHLVRVTLLHQADCHPDT